MFKLVSGAWVVHAVVPHMALLRSSSLLFWLRTASASVYTFNDHGEAIHGWYEAFQMSSWTGRATLVHFDSHGDMGMPDNADYDFWLEALGPRKDKLTPEELAQSVSINNFIMPAVLLGLVERVIWVKPAWATEVGFGSYRFFVGHSEERRQFVTDSAWVHGGDHFASVQEGERIQVLRRFRVDVVPFNAESLDKLHWKGPFILDVDLDVFSTENTVVSLLRELFDEETIQQFHACRCRREACSNMDHLENTMAQNLGAQQTLEVSSKLCDTPVHFSSSSDIEDAKQMLYNWLTRLRDLSSLRPSVVTVSVSANSYLPPTVQDLVSGVAEDLANTYDEGPPIRLGCGSCKSVHFKNDLSTDADLIWQDTDKPHEYRHQSIVHAGGEKRMESYVGHTFFLRFFGAGQVPVEYRQVTIGKGPRNTTVVASELPLCLPGELVPAPGEQQRMQVMQLEGAGTELKQSEL